MGLPFSRLTLAQKFLAFLLFASVIPLLVVGFTSYTISANVLREESARYAAELLTAQKDYLERYLEEMSGLTENLAKSEAVRAALEYRTPAESPVVRYTAQANITRQLGAYPGLQGLVSIDLFTLDGVHYHVGETGNAIQIRPEVKNKLYAQALNSRSGVTWAGIEDNVNLISAYPKVITTARILTRPGAGAAGREPAGLLLINCDPEAIYRHFSQFDLGEGAYLMVLDAENRIVYHPDKSLLGVQAEAVIGDHLTDLQGKFVDTVNGQEMLANYERSIASRWTVISFIPLKTLRASTVGIQRAALLTLGLAFLLVFFSAAMVSRSFVAPIREITQRLKGFQEGTLDLRQRLEIKCRDEIGELQCWFNTFLDSLVARQQAEEALRQSEERYSLALRGANDGIWDWHLENNRMYYSARWKSMLGFGEDQLKETPEEWFSRVHPEDITRLMEDIHNHLNGTTAHFQNEHRLLAADGKTYRWVLARGLAVRDESGRALRIAGSLSDVTTRKAYEEQLRHDAMYDGLTKLPNRAYFIEQVRHAIEYTRRRRSYSAAVLCLNLDSFKIVNDSLGHASGDELLVVVARRLQQCLRAGDTVARLGGDEFAVLLDDLDNVYDAIQIAVRLQQTLSLPVKLETHEVFTSVSIGIAMVTASYERAEDLLRDADTAMNRAKSSGRGRYEIFDAHMHARTLALLNLETELRRAVEREEFTVHYQPVIELESGALSAVEALLRWQHPLRGLVLPGEFVWLLEENGLIMTVGERVLRTAAAFAKRLQGAGFDQVAVSVNISARQLQDPRLPEQVQSALQEAGISPSRLWLEITESAAMSDFDLTLEIMRKINALGVGFSIDDFGTSYSSLGYLKRFPVRSIKISQAFIQDVPTNPDSAAITTAILAMAHILGLEVVAEGVETEEQLAFLVSQRCNQAQGFLISPALAEEELIGLLRTRSQFLPHTPPESPAAGTRSQIL